MSKAASLLQFCTDEQQCTNRLCTELYEGQKLSSANTQPQLAHLKFDNARRLCRKNSVAGGQATYAGGTTAGSPKPNLSDESNALPTNVETSIASCNTMPINVQ